MSTAERGISTSEAETSSVDQTKLKEILARNPNVILLGCNPQEVISTRAARDIIYHIGMRTPERPKGLVIQARDVFNIVLAPVLTEQIGTPARALALHSAWISMIEGAMIDERRSVLPFADYIRAADEGGFDSVKFVEQANLVTAMKAGPREGLTVGVVDWRQADFSNKDSAAAMLHATWGVKGVARLDIRQRQSP